LNEPSDYRFLQPWSAFLPRDGGHVVSLFGGGGKTSLLRIFARVYRDLGVPILLTTTTRSEPVQEAGLTVTEWDGRGASAVVPSAPCVYVHAGAGPDGKWRGLTPEQLEGLGLAHPGRVILVETDGSAKLPVKLHRPDEPLWPRQTSLAVAVVGLAALGRPVREVLHRHGRLPVPWHPGLAGESIWTWDHFEDLLIGPGGYLERIPRPVPAMLALTQMGSQRDSPGLFGFVGRVMSRTEIPLVLLGELAGETTSLQTVCRIEP
jgi:probable selenium-dependent hydroxylase accessory protein YqeC